MGGGGRVPAYPSMATDPSNSVQDILKGISNSELGEPIQNESQKFSQKALAIETEYG